MGGQQDNPVLLNYCFLCLVQNIWNGPILVLFPSICCIFMVWNKSYSTPPLKQLDAHIQSPVSLMVGPTTHPCWCSPMLWQLEKAQSQEVDVILWKDNPMEESEQTYLASWHTKPINWSQLHDWNKSLSFVRAILVWHEPKKLLHKNNLNSLARSPTMRAAKTSGWFGCVLQLPKLWSSTRDQLLGFPMFPFPKKHVSTITVA